MAGATPENITLQQFLQYFSNIFVAKVFPRRYDCR
jgi:hypothetical protein